MEHCIYDLIECYARGMCDTECFTGEFTALCLNASALDGLSREEAALIDTLCAGARRFSGDEEAFPSSNLLDEAQFRTFFDRLYPELKRRMPFSVDQAFRADRHFSK